MGQVWLRLSGARELRRASAHSYWELARRAEAGLGGGGHIFEGLMWEELLEETVWLAEAVAAEANGRPRASPGTLCNFRIQL